MDSYEQNYKIDDDDKESKFPTAMIICIIALFIAIIALIIVLVAMNTPQYTTIIEDPIINIISVDVTPETIEISPHNNSFYVLNSSDQLRSTIPILLTTSILPGTRFWISGTYSNAKTFTISTDNGFYYLDPEGDSIFNVSLLANGVYEFIGIDRNSGLFYKTNAQITGLTNNN